MPPGAQPYLNYFALPGKERYYTTTLGHVEVFALDSDPAEPDGIVSTSVQAMWLKDALAKSTARWKIVTMHHPPFSSGAHGSNVVMQWPFATWGAMVVLAGHDHDYERIAQPGMMYIVNGSGGTTLRPFGTIVPGSVARFGGDNGALLIEADECAITFMFVSRTNERIDTYTPPARCAWLPIVQRQADL